MDKLATKDDLKEVLHHFEKRFEKLDHRFEELDHRFEKLEAKMTIKLGSLLVGAIALMTAIQKLM